MHYDYNNTSTKCDALAFWRLLPTAMRREYNLDDIPMPSFRLGRYILLENGRLITRDGDCIHLYKIEDILLAFNTQPAKRPRRAIHLSVEHRRLLMACVKK